MLRQEALENGGRDSDAAAFIAVCSRRPIADGKLTPVVYFDNETDFTQTHLAQERRLNQARFEAYSLGEAMQNLANGQVADSSATEATLQMLRATLAERRRLEDMMCAKDRSLAEVRAALAATQTDLNTLRRTKWFQLRDVLIQGSWTPRKFARIAWLFFTLLIPRRLRVKLAAATERLLQRFNPGTPGPAADAVAAHVVRVQTPVASQRERVIHVIANFMTGGSSRLVVDLIEHLSEKFEHSVVTSFIPNPPAYTGLAISEFRRPDDENVFIHHFRAVQPAFIHVHYWGDCDEPWYALAIRAAETLGIPLVENVNTPVTPFSSPNLVRCVYVSDYVRATFGREAAGDLTIHPGSDFQRFDRDPSETVPGDCVGMVYRLEKDKLDEQAIDPFIRIVQLRPQTRVLIIGGGTLLRMFQRAVLAAGVADHFEFTGYVSYEQLPQLYRRLTLFLAPVWKESFGQVSAFAMNMRIPVIGYDVGAITEIVDDGSLVAPPADAQTLAEIAVRLLDSAELRNRIGERQQQRARELFSLPAMCRKYEELYAEVCAERRVERDGNKGA
jgi:glycosyltransferase involved in cell wall biosynthesis